MRTNILEYIDKKVGRFPDSVFGEGARCSAYLKDGTYLPCVLMRDWNKVVSLFLKRLNQEKSGIGVFGKNQELAEETLIRFFMSNQNIVKLSDIDRVEPSPYAIPRSMVEELNLETPSRLSRKTTGGFALQMNDGQVFYYRNIGLHQEFYDIPKGYRFSDVEKFHKVAVYIKINREVEARIENENESVRLIPDVWFTHKPFFVCYTDGFGNQSQ